MTDEKKLPEADDQEAIVVITDEKGQETFFREEMVIPLGKKNFALLVEIPSEDAEEDIDEDTDEDADDNVVVARIDFDENGEPVYLDPTDEEFAMVKEAYDKLTEETES